MYHTTAPNILFIDAYDSFSNNIVSLLETELRVDVTVIKIDAGIADFPTFVKSFSAVVAGPGPGHPRNIADVGLIGELWKLGDEDLIPVLGICLGFQSLVCAFGGSVQPLPEPRHGISRTIRSCGLSIFKNCEILRSIQYHSLHASVGHHVRLGENSGSEDLGLWEPSETAPDLIPLAWEYAEDNLDATMGSPPVILMAVAHIDKPLCGIQFHPESICSAASARMIISNWWHEVLTWRHGEPLMARSIATPPVSPTRRSSRMSKKRINKYVGRLEQGLVRDRKLPRTKSSMDDISVPCGVDRVLPSPPATPRELRQVISKVVQASSITIPDICQSMGLTTHEMVVLDSEMHQRNDVGTHSIVGIVSPNSVKLEYKVRADHVIRQGGGHSSRVDLGSYGGSVFDYIKSFMSEHEAAGGNPNIPFWGGLMGYITYEACLETIDILAKQSPWEEKRPDLSFVLVERSIVISHRHNTVTIQSIRESDLAWVHSTAKALQSVNSPHQTIFTPSFTPSFTSTVRYPPQTAYKAAIRSCQREIRKGNAYELCLTNKAYIRTNPKHLQPWQLYIRLRALNAAPFGAYLHLGQLTILSSSPERFLQWSRPKTSCLQQGRETIRCQFRPIKGTVKKSRAITGMPEMTLAEATGILSTDKERAENLMIVDLIRHDLHGVVGSGKVSVPKLMVVEEYETLFQLVTVIEGDLLLGSSNTQVSKGANDRIRYGQVDECYQHREEMHKQARLEPADAHRAQRVKNCQKSGIDILAASLPPGSMTGAPKRRACQILQSLEDHKPRGVYSGVLGYLDVGGGGDFSVIIRSAVRWDKAVTNGSMDDNTAQGGQKRPKFTDLGFAPSNKDVETMAPDAREADEWTIGAGGAVTSLSTEDGEWEEMMAKLRSTLRLFETNVG